MKIDTFQFIYNYLLISFLSPVTSSQGNAASGLALVFLCNLVTILPPCPPPEDFSMESQDTTIQGPGVQALQWAFLPEDPLFSHLREKPTEL